MELTNAQRAWLIEYSKTTSFEAIGVEDYLAGEHTWEELQNLNIYWFMDWAHETHTALLSERDKLPEPIGFRRGGYGANVDVLYEPNQNYWYGLFAETTGIGACADWEFWLGVEHARAVRRVTLDQCSNLRMASGGESTHPVVIQDGRVREWVGIGWLGDREAEPEDYLQYPVVTEGVNYV